MTSAVLGIGLLVVAVGAVVARYVPIPGHRTLYVVIASPYLMAAAPLALLLLLWGHRWVMAAVAVCISVALIVPQVPWYIAASPNPNAVSVRAMTINMLYGRADPQSIVGIATDQADVLMVQELTPDAAKGLSSGGIAKSFPYDALDPRPGTAGVGVYSRYPITAVNEIGGYALGLVTARIRVDGLTRDPTVASIHLTAPWPQPIDGWHRDLAALRSTLAGLAEESNGGAILVGGDFNSTIDMEPFRKLLTDGYEDSAQQAGAGRQRTYPANRRFPAFMGIDHILTRDCIAVSTETMELPGSDHRAVLATVMVPRD
ncbi:MAG TPA: endonuclease/exonuclease/phosphatase family protein [Mycobacterium sp.]|nr:endonuclease/exonuclease/phosphatase family protein [Mycobacterium sp.]